MACIRPFRAYTYSRPAPDISDLVAPPYDVISEEQRRALLARSPHNVVALELAEGPLDPSAPDNRYVTAARRWADWRAQGVVVRDKRPSLYLLEQRFVHGGSTTRRRALVAEVRLHAFDEGIVLPHERTLPKALGDRFNLIQATHANFSQVFGLTHDPEQVMAEAFDLVSHREPTLCATDEDGVESDVWAITDPKLIALITEALADQRVFIADGHHRYTVALAYRDRRRSEDAAGGRRPSDPDYDYVMMALSDMDDPDLVVLPTHRVADAVDGFDPARFDAALRALFDAFELPAGQSPQESLEAAPTSRPAFIVRTRAHDRPRLLVLKEAVDLDSAIASPRSRAWKALDVAVLQELVLRPLLGIDPDDPASLERLTFVKDADEAMRMCETHDAAFVLRPTRMDQMRAVALAGDVMPQKSTYFYPKLLSGLVFRSMGEPPQD